MIAGGSAFADALMAIHFAAGLLGLGAVLVAVALGLRVLFQRRGAPGSRAIARLHAFVIFVLCLILATGVAMLSLWLELICAPGEGPMLLRIDPTRLPDKSIVHLTMTAALVVSAVLIDRHLIPLASIPDRPLLPYLHVAEIARLAVIGCLSLGCWLSLAATWAWPPLQAWRATDLLGLAAIGWLGLAAATMLFLLAGRFVMRRLLGQRPSTQYDGSVDEQPEWPGAAGQTAPNTAYAGPAQVGAFARSAAVDPATARFAMRFAPGANLDTGPNASPSASLHPRCGHPEYDFSDDPDGGDSPERVTMPDVFAACRGAVLGVGIISLVTNLLMLAGPLYMLQIYDRVLTSRSVETLAVLTVLLVGLYAVLGLLEVIRSHILSRLALRIDRLVGPHLLASAIAVAQPSADAQAGQPLRDLEQIRNFVSGPAPPAFMDLPWTPLYFAVVYLMHPLLGAVALAGAAVLIALSVANEYLTRKPLARAAAQSAECHALVEAGRRSAETLKAMGMTGAHRRRWMDDHRQALTAQLEAGDIAGVLTVSIRICRLLLQSFILATGAWLALQDAVSAGAMIAASIIATRALAPIEQIVGQWRGVLGVRAAIARCHMVLDRTAPTTRQLLLPAPRGELIVNNLYVAALGGREPVLKGLRFRLEPGDGLAVLGPSAAGKSTLARALVGVWPLRHGEIRLDGAALEQWEPRQLGRHIGYLPQDAALLDGTIAENISRFSASPDPQAVLSAAAEAGVHDLILQLPQGYATRVGESGKALSGGQRQRVALARALFGAPALLVLDEPNANLDADGETALVNAIIRARQAGRTVVVMAHRQSVLKATNLVLVLRDGRQVAFGPPADILRAERTVPKKEQVNGPRAAIANAPRTR